MSVEIREEISGIPGVGRTDTARLIDVTDTEALLVRANGDTADVLRVDTTNEQVGVPSHDGSTKGLSLGGALVTASAAELNLLDGETSIGGAFVESAGVILQGGTPGFDEDFVFGSTQLDDTGTALHDSRFFFDKSMYAWRAGRAQGAEWDFASIGTASTVSGGDNNTAGGTNSAVGGGVSNDAQGLSSTIGGGDSNAASLEASTIGGGKSNTASQAQATVGGGLGNTASQAHATVGGGDGNTASAAHATVGGGDINVASGTYAAIPGGRNNAASGDAASSCGGYSGIADKYIQHVHGSQGFAVAGDVQYSRLILRADTIDATQETMHGNNSVANRLVIPAQKAWNFNVDITATTANCASSAAYNIKGLIHRDNANNTEIVGSVTVTTLAEDVAGWDVTASADDTNEALAIQVTGAAATTIRWVATVHLTEVGF